MIGDQDHRFWSSDPAARVGAEFGHLDSGNNNGFNDNRHRGRHSTFESPAVVRNTEWTDFLRDLNSSGQPSQAPVDAPDPALYGMAGETTVRTQPSRSGPSPRPTRISLGPQGYSCQFSHFLDRGKASCVVGGFDEQSNTDVAVKIVLSPIRETSRAIDTEFALLEIVKSAPPPYADRFVHLIYGTVHIERVYLIFTLYARNLANLPSEADGFFLPLRHIRTIGFQIYGPGISSIETSACKTSFSKHGNLLTSSK
ncbi:hypothetical protein PLICRDRAFT_176928 [Plicaturopsis crispa FD-325 SS-3]|nr:hypothetical protein PLICRDRAFT_176928 [Plicaturopsis crispa FD-325 SS-3]